MEVISYTYILLVSYTNPWYRYNTTHRYAHPPAPGLYTTYRCMHVPAKNTPKPYTPSRLHASTLTPNRCIHVGTFEQVHPSTEEYHA